MKRVFSILLVTLAVGNGLSSALSGMATAHSTASNTSNACIMTPCGSNAISSCGGRADCGELVLE